ncbi:iron-siderophore ABC transporter substrate-binding protein [Saccharomonospora sp. NPDC046836]|uniref:ABC transporter substrate-binding protein n=1 Tax=Saccharomonospora sp. NPDC046836 TaxID=3156921 RepID=UPI0033C55910
MAPPITTLRRTLSLLSGAILIAFLAGCAAGTEHEEDQSAAADIRAVSIEPHGDELVGAPVSINAEDSWDEVVGPYADFGTSLGAGEFPRIVRHALGDTEIPEQPRRVVTLDSGETEAVLALDIVPVGIAETPNLPETVADLPKVGSVGEPNLEAILALEPDLILSNASRDEALYEQLSAIAPTVMGIKTGAPWQQNTELYAMALGREETVAEVKETYEARSAQVRQLRGDERPEVSFVRIRTDDLRLYQRSSFPGTVLAGAGLPRPEESNLDTNNIDLSPEQVERIDADVLFVAVDDDVATEEVDALLDSDLWQSLGAVSAGNVHIVDASVWYASSGYEGAHQMLTDVETALTTYQPR